MDFIVRTDESVSGTYTVDAEDELEAKELIEDLVKGRADWSRISQTDYMAFDIEVTEVEAG